MGKKQTAWHTCPSTKRVIVMIYCALDNTKLFGIITALLTDCTVLRSAAEIVLQFLSKQVNQRH